MNLLLKTLNEVRSLKREMKQSNLYRKKIYTLKEAATVIGVSDSYIQKMVASKSIKHSKPSGKLIFIRRKDLEDFIMRNPILTNDEVDSIVANTLLNLKTKTS